MSRCEQDGGSRSDYVSRSWVKRLLEGHNYQAMFVPADGGTTPTARLA
jgi:hypothetical protein